MSDPDKKIFGLKKQVALGIIGLCIGLALGAIAGYNMTANYVEDYTEMCIESYNECVKVVDDLQWGYSNRDGFPQLGFNVSDVMGE